MSRTTFFEKRISALEAKDILKQGKQWPPLDCDPWRRLARYAAHFENRPWECTGTPERKAPNEARLARYKKYFDELFAKHGREDCHEEHTH
jgi:hypothetical protein